jgi:hypothetical protein
MCKYIIYIYMIYEYVCFYVDNVDKCFLIHKKIQTGMVSFYVLRGSKHLKTLESGVDLYPEP